jgi:hypothetical protein
VDGLGIALDVELSIQVACLGVILGSGSVAEGLSVTCVWLPFHRASRLGLDICLGLKSC